MLKALKYFALAICATCILAILPVLYLLPRQFDPQGRANGSCFVNALPVVANGAGMSVTGHHTICDNMIHTSAIFVYLHKSGEPDSSRSLIFRYADDPLVAPPKIKWVNASTVSVSVGNVSQVTKQVSSLDGIHIVYSIGKEEFSREAWERSGYDLRLLEVGLFAATLTLLALCWFLVRSLRRSRRPSG